uniref:von Willebrand factor A domain containing 11 n=1 Tax=Oncorhynchus mykiss TaxID=8022 RepID=A0A8K9WXP8_ONCMY
MRNSYWTSSHCLFSFFLRLVPNEYVQANHPTSLKHTYVSLQVSFFMTNDGAGARRRRRGVESRAATFETYKDLALASGGQAIGVTKENLPQATDVIIDSSTSALVTVLQRARNPGKAETFSFLLDESLNNITIYITGKSLTFTLKNPAGVTQKQNEVNGELGTVQTVGNLFRVRLASNKQTGLWEISMNSNQPYTLKVTGQSTIAFIYDFVETFDGPHPGYALISGRPQAGMPAMLLVSVLGRKGPASVKVANVALVTVSGSEVVSGALEDMGNGEILVTVTNVPAGEFVVLLNGTDVVSSTVFQRQSTTQMSVSKVTIKAVVDRSMEPGKTFTLPFTVMTDTTGGSYKISARNDRDFKMNVPGSIAVTTGGNATGELTITVPANTPSGTDVTLTIEAVAPGATADSNYAVLRLSVVSKVTDFTPPQCEVVSVSSVDCPADPAACSSAFWQLSANMTDGVNGTGIASLTHRQGVGNLTHTDLKQMVVAAAFNASCCSLTVELVALDKAMNVGTCLYTTKVTDVTPPQCEVVSVSSVDCPADPAACNSAFWQLSANLTDGVNGTGIASLTHRQGVGSLTHTDLKQMVVAAAFNASCCSLTVELVAVDKAMNVGTCLYTTKVTWHHRRLVRGGRLITVA